MKKLNKYVYRDKLNYYVIPKKGTHLILRRKHFNKFIIEEMMLRMTKEDYVNCDTFASAAARLEAQCTLDYLITFGLLNIN